MDKTNATGGILKIKTRNYWVGLFFLLKNYKRRYGSVFTHIKRYNRWSRELKNPNIYPVENLDQKIKEQLGEK